MNLSIMYACLFMDYFLGQRALENAIHKEKG